MSVPPTAGAALPAELLAALLGVDDPQQIEFTSEILAALQKISPDLVPRLTAHPLADAIARGIAAYDDLLADYERQKEDRVRAAIVDAIGEIITREHATREVVAGLEKILSNASSPQVASLAAKAIALAGHTAFLEQQRKFLASDKPSEVRVAAKLLGYGKYEPAVEMLAALLNPSQMAVADVVVWALGEIGSERALVKLHGMLSDLVLVDDVIEAVGKIGSTVSVIQLLPWLAAGTTTQRENAARALVRIARKNGGDLLDAALRDGTMNALESTLDTDASRSARFHAIVAHSVLGGRLSPGRIRAALGMELTDGDVGALSGLLAKPASTPHKAKRRPLV